VLRSDGRQTSILTTNQHLEKTLVAYRQFNRWRQENFFKYMLEEFELDGLLEYGADQVSSEADRPNPARRPLERQLAAARQRVQSLQAQLGSEVAPKGATPQRTTRGFKRPRTHRQSLCGRGRLSGRGRESFSGKVPSLSRPSFIWPKTLFAAIISRDSHPTRTPAAPCTRNLRNSNIVIIVW
jgi:hypothetical protein